MLILVDAYNLLKQVLHVQFVTDDQRKAFMKEFEDYARVRNNRVILVFDGDPSWEDLDRSWGYIEVVYSGKLQSADDWIKQYLCKEHGKDILLVSSDRDIRNSAARSNIESIKSLDFYDIMKSVMDHEASVQKKIKSTVYKTAESDNVDLDKLMEEGSRMLVDKKLYHYDEPSARMSNSKKKSKKDKRLLRKVSKI